MTTVQRWTVMAILGMSGGIIFFGPFLREVFYQPLQDALLLNNTQMGVLLSVFGAVSMISYFPGGWLADRVSSRKLIAIGMSLTGLSGFAFATFPSYAMSIAIHGFWGITITFIFWGAMIKATRNWAPADQQGRAYGILEMGRGLAEVAGFSILLAIFTWLGSNKSALSTVVITFSAFNLSLGIATWWIFTDNDGGKDETQPVIGLKQVMAVIKLPVVWLIAIVILCAYSAYSASYYYTPYVSDAFSTTATMAGVIAIGRMWLKPATALAAGFVGDRYGIARSCMALFAILVASFVFFTMIPGTPTALPVAIGNIAISAMAIFALRGIYFALLEEGGIPVALTGTAAGVAAAVGFIPDIYIPLVAGILIDKFPGATGYQYMFGFVAALCAAGFLASWQILRIQKRTG